MKNILTLALVAVMSMAVFVGCGQNDTASDNNNQQAQVQSQEQASESPASDQQETIVEDGEVMDPSKADLIGAEKAKKIALDKVDGAVMDDLKQFDLDYDNGRWVYEGEIYKGDWEYEFEINAENGNVISWEKDRIYD